MKEEGKQVFRDYKMGSLFCYNPKITSKKRSRNDLGLSSDSQPRCFKIVPLTFGFAGISSQIRGDMQIRVSQVIDSGCS
jgi:hypothetical protein